MGDVQREDLERRVRDVEEAYKEQQKLLNQLVTNTAVMNANLEMLTKQVMPKISELEIKLANNSQVIQAIKWGAMVIGGGGASMILAYLFGGG